MGSRNTFDFKVLKAELAKLQYVIGGTKGATLATDVNNLEAAIRKNDISEFDKACSSIEKTLNASNKAKTKTARTKLKELGDIVDKGRERGNPLRMINIEENTSETGQQLSDGKRTHDDETLLEGSGNKRPQSKTKGRLEGSGDKRPQSKAKDSTSKEDQLTLHEEEMIVIRNKLYNACTKHTDKKPPTPQSTYDLARCISETGVYADNLIGHLEMKSGVKGVQLQGAQLKKEQEAKQEAKQVLEKVNTWLERLRDQVEKNCLDETAFKSSTDSNKSDDKRTRKNIEDICVKLRHKKEEETTKVAVERQQLASDIDALIKETTGKSKMAQDVQKQDNSKRIQNLTKQLKQDKEDVLNEIRAIYKSFWDWRTSLCKEKKFVFKRSTSNMISETDTVKLLSEVSMLQKELLMVTEKEEEELMQELHELKMDVENERNGEVDLEKPTKWNEGPRKDIRYVRLQFHAKTRTMLSSDPKSKNEKEQNKAMTNELKNHKEYIKKFWRILTEDKHSKAMSTDTSTALVELEKIMTENTKKLNKYEETIRSVTQDMNNLKGKIRTIQKNVTTGENADHNEKNENEPMKMLNYLETYLINNRQQLDLFYSIKKDLETEIRCLQQETEAHNWNNPAFGPELKIDKKTPQLLIDVSQIKKNLKERKEETYKKEEEMKKREIWIKDETTKLWRTVCVNRVTGAEHVTGGDGKDVAVKMFSDISKQLKKWDHDRKDVQMFTSELEDAVAEIQSIITAEPFSFTEPQPLDQAAVVRNTSTVTFHPVKIGLAWVIKCLKKNRESFPERYVKMERYSAVQENESILRRHLEKLETEKLELLNRLSKVAGARLTDNNPNIADLSDQNRPTKIGEKYSELYDNGWTDALEVLDMPEEKQRVEYLLNILVVSYKACEEISVSQQRTIIRALTSPSEVMTAENRGVMSGIEAELSSVQSRALVELRKQSTDLSVGSVKKHVKKEHKDWFKRTELEKYTTECIDLCWLMHVQSPPVCLETKVKPGSKFDSNIYKSFTKNGKKIDFLVWPALLLHEKGSVVCKGVAQLK